jgi:hypothetical protein
MNLELIKLIRGKLSYFFATAYMRERFYVKVKCPHCMTTSEGFQIGQKNTCFRCSACKKDFWAGAIYMCNGGLEKLQEELARATYKINEVQNESEDTHKDL